MSDRSRNRTGIPALPKCHYTLKAIKPPESAVSYRPYPYLPITLGDYLRKKRLDLCISQNNVAELFGVTECSVYNWETNHKQPTVKYLPKLITFIGFCPYDVTWPTAKKLIMWRSFNGLSQKQMAELIGIDQSTLAKYEQSKRVIKSENLTQIKEICIKVTDPMNAIPVQIEAEIS